LNFLLWRKIFLKNGPKSAFFARVLPFKNRKNRENRKSTKQTSPNRLGPTVKVVQNRALSSKNIVLGPNSNCSPSYGQNENFGNFQKFFFSKNFFLDPKDRKK
jgi:hypothetical protein